MRMSLGSGFFRQKHNLKHCLKYTVAWLLVFQLIVPASWAAPEIQWEQTLRTAIRTDDNARNCRVYLSPADPTVNDSVGIHIADGSIEEFRDQISKVVVERGREAIEGADIFVTGIAMGKEAETESVYRAVLAEQGFSESQVRVRVLSVPKNFIEKNAEGILKKVMTRMRYFFPSIDRHYQKPLKSEIVSGAVTTALIEVPNIIYIYKNYPQMDANFMVGTHAALLAAYTIYTRFMTNWLLTPGTGGVEKFIKQLSLSLPFVANYNIFGNLSKIVAFYQTHGWAATSAQFPSELATFATSQGFTLLLQTLFYNIVINKGIGGWVTSQTGTENSVDARTLSSVISLPILVFDAIILAQASAGAHQLISIGPFEVNTGHVYLAALTLVGSSLWMWPKIMNPTSTVWRKLKSLFGFNSPAKPS